MLAELILLGTLQVTSYRAVPEQTKPECIDKCHCYTSIGEAVHKGGIAASQDLLASGAVHYGDYVYVDGYGVYQVNDTMNKRIHNAVDIFVLTLAQERQINVKRLRVWKLNIKP